MKVSMLLEIINNLQADDLDNIYALDGAPFGSSGNDTITEFPCIGLTEMEIDPARNGKKEKAVVITEIFTNMDYFKCINVKELKEFLNQIKDKDEKVYIVAPLQYYTGWYVPVLNCMKREEDTYSSDDSYQLKMRQITGENILHLIF